MMKERVAIYKWNGLDGKNIPNGKNSLNARKGTSVICEGLGYESKATGIDKGDALMFSLTTGKQTR